jgi:Mlc titration factor MtfA (ptsG expression regulator)
MFLTWLKSRRRRRLLQTPLAELWRSWIASNVWHWHVLSNSQRRRLEGLVQIFVAEKDFEGCDGLKVTDEIRVTIASAACMLLLGFEDTYCFDSARTILVYPVPTVQRNLRRADGSVSDFQWLSGMVQHRGPVILSWRDVLRDCRHSQRLNNVVIHEFAHHVDGLDGAMEGVPPFPTRELQDRWKQVSQWELESLRQLVRSGLPTLLDPYGMENAAEFFAVATEAFYCDGWRLAEEHSELYELLVALFGIETRSWFQPISRESDLL